MHTLTVDGFSGALRVIRFHGSEGVSELFHFDVLAVSDDTNIALRDMIGKAAVLSIPSMDEPRIVHGIIRFFEQGDESKTRSSYRLKIVPLVHRLRLRKASRIFQELEVPKIVQKVLEAAGVPGEAFRMSLGSYEVRNYCVQYRESDWDFISRLLEEEGIHYFFEHSESGHVLVFADDATAHSPIAGEAALPYRQPTGALAMSEHVSHFRWAEEMRSGKAILRDYNFKTPALDLEVETEGELDTDLEVYDYPGEYEAPGGGTPLAKARQNEHDTPRKRGGGAGTCSRFAPGATFTLAEHARDALNADYLLVRVEHRGSEPHVEGGNSQPRYENDFEVVPAAALFRPPRVTPRPVVHGIQTAIVVGPSGEEIHTDEFGRIKVQFHWDREGKKDDTSSCWMRVAQAWAGGSFGFMALPRVGHEVVVSFLEGDPDRPLVTGSVYHATNVVPYTLPADKTKSTLKSQSSPGGGGFNELRFEDKKDSEEIYLHAQKDLTIETLHDKNQTVGNDETLAVTGNRTKSVDGNEDETVGGNRTETITADMTIEVGANLKQTVGANYTFGIDGNIGAEIGGDVEVTVTGSRTETIETDSTEDVQGARSLTVGKAFSLAVSEDYALAIDGGATEDVGTTKAVTVGSEYTLTVGSGTITVKKSGEISIEGSDLTIKGTGSVKVQGPSIEVKADATITVESSGTLKVKGATVDVN